MSRPVAEPATLAAPVKGPIAGILFVVALFLATFFLTRSDEPKRGLSREELSWVHGYSSWWASELETFFRAYGASTESVELRQLRAPFAALERCTSSYTRLAAPAPDSLRDVESLSQRACSRAASAVRDVRENPTVAHPRRSQYVALAINTLREADSQLLKHLVLENPIASHSGPTSRSRSDPLYSDAATTVTRFNIDVRCWSRGDWAKIERETRAIGPETAKRFFAVAGAFEGVANLPPTSCAPLDRLAYEHELPSSRVEERRLVASLATLGREAERGAGTGSDVEGQCDGLQEVRPLAEKLGATASQAARLAAVGWRLYRARRLGPWSRECHDDGPFDRDGSHVWP